MRQIEYELKMRGQYDITNGFEKTDPDDIEEDEAVKLPGIKMTVERSNDCENFFSCFCPVELFDCDESDWMANWVKAVRGESTSWKLTAIRILHGYMWLDFLNQELYELNRQMAAKGCEEDARPEYHGVLTWCIGDSSSNEDLRLSTYLRFELTHDDTPPETYLVHIGSGAFTTVTEFEGNKKREFMFEQGSSRDEYGTVKVTEYMGAGFTGC